MRDDLVASNVCRSMTLMLLINRKMGSTPEGMTRTLRLKPMLADSIAFSTFVNADHQQEPGVLRVVGHMLMESGITPPSSSPQAWYGASVETNCAL